MIWLNNEPKIVPSSLHEMTLQQRIDWQQQYGNDLDEKARNIAEIKDELEKEIEIAEYQFEKMFTTMAFFLNCTVEAIKESKYIDEIASIYYSCLYQFFKEEDDLEPQYEFTWKDSLWVITHPELKNGDRMSFGEFIDSKQIVQNLLKLGKGKWECLIPLAAIFLRKQGEDYSEDFLNEDSERLKLMAELPMDMALQLGFFLTSSLNMFIQTSPSFSQQESKEVVSM